MYFYIFKYVFTHAEKFGVGVTEKYKYTHTDLPKPNAAYMRTNTQTKMQTHMRYNHQYVDIQDGDDNICDDDGCTGHAYTHIHTYTPRCIHMVLPKVDA
jgi:hypothetical protein